MVSGREAQTQKSDPFTSIPPYQFILLTTFRKTGVGVSTIVWFALHEGKIYVRTPAATGKLKRIRNNKRVTLAGCKANSHLIGETAEGGASILTGEEVLLADKALLDKYGWLYRIFTGFQKIRGVQGVYIKIQPAGI